MGKMIVVFLLLAMLNSTKAAAQLNFKQSADTVEKKISLRVLPQNFYNQHLGYFCKKESQLQKVTALAIFIRLGSKEYVDYLERKPNTFLNPFKRN
jgi:hypothetical protein